MYMYIYPMFVIIYINVFVLNADGNEGHDTNGIHHNGLLWHVARVLHPLRHQRLVRHLQYSSRDRLVFHMAGIPQLYGQPYPLRYLQRRVSQGVQEDSRL